MAAQLMATETQTAAEFYVAYCERSGVEPEWMASSGRRAYRCSCGEDGCEGWAMLNAEDVQFDRDSGFPTLGIDPSDQGYAP